MKVYVLQWEDYQDPSYHITGVYDSMDKAKLVAEKLEVEEGYQLKWNVYGDEAIGELILDPDDDTDPYELGNWRITGKAMNNESV